MGLIQKTKKLLFVLALSTFGIFMSLLTLPERSAAQISAQAVSTVVCNGTISATSMITLVGKIMRDPFTTPVNHVQVFIFDTLSADGRSCFSDINGQYTATMDAAHTYDVVFNPPSGSKLASHIETGIDEAGLMTRNIPLTQGFSISGTTLRLSDSNPITDVEIFAANKKTGISLGLPPSDSTTGDYQISLTPGDWDLTFTPKPFQGLAPTRTQIISLSADITQDIFLPEGFTVYGRITSSLTGQSVPGVQIFALMENGEGFGLPLSQTDGSYAGALPKKSFDIQYLPPTGQGLGPVVITNQMATTETFQIPVTLPEGVALTGTVSCDTPLAGIFVFADPVIDIPEDEIGGVGDTSDSQGNFGLPLISGTYRIEFKPPSAIPLPIQEITRTIQGDTFLIFDFCPIYMPLIFKDAG